MVSIDATSAKSDGYLCEQDGSQAHLPGQMKHEMHLSDGTERHSAWLVGPNSPKKLHLRHCCEQLKLQAQEHATYKQTEVRQCVF